MLPRAPRFKRPLLRCKACDPNGGSQWSCSTSCGRSSVRLPTGGGALVRFDFHEIGCPGWIRTINLPSQNRALFCLSYGAKRGAGQQRIWPATRQVSQRRDSPFLRIRRRLIARLTNGCRQGGSGGWNRTNFLQLMRLTSDRCSSPGWKTILRPALPRHGLLYERSALLNSATEEWLARKRL